MEVSSGGGTAYLRENWGCEHACLALASCRCVLLSFTETSGAHPLVHGCFPRGTSTYKSLIVVPSLPAASSFSPGLSTSQGLETAFRVGKLDQETF